MPKALCITAMAIAGLLLLLFGLDLAISFPFAKANAMMDMVFIVCAGVLGYLGWAAYREQV